MLYCSEYCCRFMIFLHTDERQKLLFIFVHDLNDLKGKSQHPHKSYLIFLSELHLHPVLTYILRLYTCCYFKYLYYLEVYKLIYSVHL